VIVAVTIPLVARMKSIHYEVRSDRGVLCERCEFGDTAGFRMKGLLGRRSLAEGEGIWLKPCNSIHMFFMGFAIDAVFLDGENRVVKVYPSLQPWRISSVHWRAKSVLEIPAGCCARQGLQAGDLLTFSEK